MELSVLTGIMIPFVGTMLGSACVFFMAKKMNVDVYKRQKEHRVYKNYLKKDI